MKGPGRFVTICDWISYGVQGFEGRDLMGRGSEWEESPLLSDNVSLPQVGQSQARK